MPRFSPSFLPQTTDEHSRVYRLATELEHRLLGDTKNGLFDTENPEVRTFKTYANSLVLSTLPVELALPIPLLHQHDEELTRSARSQHYHASPPYRKCSHASGIGRRPRAVKLGAQ